MNIFVSFTFLPPQRHHLEVVAKITFTEHKVVKVVVELSVREVVNEKALRVVVKRDDCVLGISTCKI